MKEHFNKIVAINTRARERLITTDGGTTERAFTVGHGSNGTLELLGKAFREFHFDDLHYPDMMDIFYERDTDAVDDWELQGWVQDVSQNGFGMVEGGQVPSLGVPQQLKTKEELVMFLQKLIFTTSVRHHFAGYYVFQ